MKIISSGKYMLVISSISMIVLFSIIYVLVTHYYKHPHIEIDKDLLFNVLEPGKYTGESIYGATELYKNGLRCSHKVRIEKSNTGVDIVNQVTAYDLISGKHEYDGVRKVAYLYKPNHGKQLFKISSSYIDNQLVSSSYGYATGKTENSIIFHLSGSWHISHEDYHKIENVITRTDSKTIHNSLVHPRLFGFNNLVMDEKYTMDSL